MTCRDQPGGAPKENEKAARRWRIRRQVGEAGRCRRSICAGCSVVFWRGILLVYLDHLPCRAVFEFWRRSAEFCAAKERTAHRNNSEQRSIVYSRALRTISAWFGGNIGLLLAKQERGRDIERTAVDGELLPTGKGWVGFLAGPINQLS